MRYDKNKETDQFLDDDLEKETGDIFPKGLDLEDSLLHSICYAIRYHKNQNTDECLDDDLKKGNW